MGRASGGKRPVSAARVLAYKRRLSDCYSDVRPGPQARHGGTLTHQHDARVSVVVMVARRE